MEPTKQTLLVGGLLVDVYSHPTSRPSSTDPIHALFFLHGRFGSAQESYVVNIIKAIFDESYGPGIGWGERGRKILSPLPLNHGSRLVDQKRNLAWSEDPAKNNDQHAVDMYTIQTGTAEDVSFIIDHLPSFLYPSGERTIAEWGICGVSLGGHSTWIALSREPRLTLGIPIIGCPDYTKLISQRARSSGIPFSPPYFPDSFKTYIETHDPAQLPYRAKDTSNPFLGKKVLVLSGKEDKLVPWVASAEFVDGLEVGEGGVKRVVVEEGAGHECTSGMRKEAGLFVRKWLSGAGL
ncbi:Alpha/Beta hydrolase protein [Suillus subalutaceus]|uniref:Alpha/Beta hydrolase protein n=1 Tax=Suillus subalutaceus TaxID=48586 RepID=UPI001B860A15|nr:Alpha/Beta hydrolase protein [Suillus subalutaceus]KAG1836211.1 Alpha/Beta hydrolase protein [Suillus subalutaceus]